VSWALSLGLRDTALYIARLSPRDLERLILIGDRKWNLILKRRGFGEESASLEAIAGRLVERDRVLLAIAAMGGSKKDVQSLSARVLQAQRVVPSSRGAGSSPLFGAPALGSSVFRTVPIH